MGCFAIVCVSENMNFALISLLLHMKLNIFNNPNRLQNHIQQGFNAKIK